MRGGCFDTVRESAVHGLQEVTVIGKKPGNLHQKSTVLRLKYGAFLFDFLEVASRISQMPDFAGAWTTTPNSC
jgi:hypothetical protein